MSQNESNVERIEHEYAEKEAKIIAELAERKEYGDYEILEEDENSVKVRWISHEESFKPLDPDEMQIPDGYDYEDVFWNNSEDPEVEAFVVVGEDRFDEGMVRGFNPQNGRFYDDNSIPGRYNGTVAGALHVDCAYTDCNGFTNVEVEGDISSSCDECGEPIMGRGQFLGDSKKRRVNRSSIQSATQELGDEWASEMERLKDAGVGTVPAMDYLMCSVGDVPASEWAKARGIQEYTIRVNMRQVAEKVGEKVQWTP